MQVSTTAERVLSALQPYELKAERSGNSFRLNSPLRPGSNSHALRLTVAPDGEHGAYHDKVTGEHGTLYDLAKHLGVDLPPRDAGKQQQQPLKKYQSLADYAADHGVPAEVYDRAGWKETKRKDPHGVVRPALQYPVGDTVRYRFLDGAKPKYVSLPGYEAQWYGLEFAINLALSDDQPLVICNGEASTLAAQYWGVAACCVAGGEKELPENCVTQLRSAYNGSVIVALDSDKTGRTVAPQIAQQLTDAGLSAKAVELGGSDGFDLADFCHLHQHESVIGIAKLKEIGAPERLWLRGDELHLIAPPRFLVDGVIPFGEVTVVYGPGDAGKTFLVVDMAMRVAQHYPVMYVTGEDASGVRLRKEAWEKFFQRPCNPDFGIWNLGLTLQDNAMIDGFISQVKLSGARLVVIDTLSQCSSLADENNNTEMAMVMKNATRIAHECNTSVVIIHHTDKAGVNYRGASAIKDNTYGFLSVFKDDDAIALECTRIKNTIPFGKRRFRLMSVPVEIMVDGVMKEFSSAVVAPALKVVNDGKKLSSNQLIILEAVGAIAKGEGIAKSSDLMRYTKLEGNNFYKPLNRIKDWGYIEKQERPAGFVLTKKGRDYLTEEWEAANGGAKNDDKDEDTFFAVNTALFRQPSHPKVSTVPSTGISTVLSTTSSTDMSTVSTALSGDVNRSERLRSELSTVEMPVQWIEPIGLASAVNTPQTEVKETVEERVNYNPSTTSLPPVKGGEGEGGGEVSKEVIVKKDDWDKVDQKYLAKCYAAGDLDGVKRHCIMQRVKYDYILSLLQEEAELF